MKLFLDTGFFIAAINTGDARCAQARAIAARIQEREWSSVHTSDYVVAEALNFAQGRLHSKRAAEALLDVVFGRPGARPIVQSVLRVHSGRFASALERYRKRFDDGLSFTDCTTLVVMHDERIKQLATFDAGFRGLVDVVDG